MTKTIAISGKGGTGKTTLAALIVRSLIAKQNQPVLAVDADANACLGELLGIELVGTIADLRDQVREKKTSPNQAIGKLEEFEYGCHQLVTEAKGFDLIAMGRPEGPGCYCAANNILRKFLDNLSTSYDYIVIDNEAGMEHLSRRTTNKVDLLIIVAEPTHIGVLTAKRIIALIKSLPITISRVGLVWSRIDKKTDIDLDGVDILTSIPYDQAVLDIAISGKTIFDLPQDSPAMASVEKIIESFF